MITYSIYIDNLRCEVSDNSVFAITYQLQDFRDINLLRKRTVSKTFSVYGNSEINQLFQNVWDIKFTADIGFPVSFNQNKRKECVIYENEIPFLTGSIILESVVIEQGVTKYNFKFVSNELFNINKLQDIYLNELTAFNLYNHILNASTIFDSWENKIYIHGNLVNRPSGKGYLYPLGFYGSLTKVSATQSEVKPSNKFNSHKLIPCFFVAELFSECFKSIGLTATVNLPTWLWENLMISGSFEQFKKQIDGVSVSKLAKTENASDFTIYSNMYNYVNVGWHLYSYKKDAGIISNSEIQDDENNYANNVYIATRAGKLTVSIDYTEQITLINNANTIEYVVIELLVNGLYYTSQTLLYRTNVSSGTASSTLELTANVNIGDVVKVVYLHILNNNNGNLQVTNTITNFDITYKLEYTSFLSNTLVRMPDWLPNMKAIDFVSAIIKMFNLYISEIEEDTITFDTHDNFYEGWATALNAYPFIDHSRPVEIKSAIMEQGIKSITYKYKQPDDYSHKYLKDVYNIDYGTKKLIINTDICTEEKILEIPFSLAMLNQIEPFNIAYPTIYDFKNNKYEPKSFAPFLCFFNGVIFDNVTIIDIVNNQYIISTNNKYPLISPNYWDLQGNKISLYFEPPAYVLYQTGNIVETTNTIFNEFIAGEIESYLKDDGKLVKLAISKELLSKYKPNELLRKLINIDGALYKVNKIIDYNANKASIDFELIKVFKHQRGYVYPPPIFIPSFQPLDNSTLLKVANLGTRNIEQNELYIDPNNKALCISDKPVIVARKEFIGTIYQEGETAPILSKIYGTMEVGFEYVEAGLYRTTEQGQWFCMINEAEPINRPIKTYVENNHLYIKTLTNGHLRDNLIYIIKLI